MTVTADSLLVGPPSGTLHAAIDALGQQNAEYLTEMWRVATAVGLDPGIIAAQFHLETNGGTSERWVRNRNPGGLAVESDSDPDPATWTQAEAARVHVWALDWMVGRRSSVPSLQPIPDSADAFMDRWIRKNSDRGFPGPIDTIADLQKRYVDSTGEPQAVWAWDDRYATKLVARHRAIFGAGGTEPVGRLLTIDYSPLPCPVIIDLIPETQPNQNPGIELGKPTSGTWHETANTAAGANALMHQRYLNNGADGSQISWHFTVDDTRIVQHMPLDRVAWHAGDGAGPGNMSSIAVECCVNSDGNLRRAQEHQAALFGLLRAKGVLGDVWQHNHWSGKDCPKKLRAGEGGFTWTDAQSVIRSYAQEYGAQPPTTQPAPIWWEPGDIGPQQRESDGAWALAMLGEVTAKRKVPVRVSADSSSTVIETLEIGDKRKLVGTGKYRNRWNFIEVSPGVYGRALWSAFHERFPTL